MESHERKAGFSEETPLWFLAYGKRLAHHSLRLFICGWLVATVSCVSLVYMVEGVLPTFFLCLFCFCLSVHGKFRCSILLCLYVHEMLWLKHLLQMVFMHLPSYFCEDDNCQYVTKARDAWEAAQENIRFSFFLFCGANNCQDYLCRLPSCLLCITWAEFVWLHNVPRLWLC